MENKDLPEYYFGTSDDLTLTVSGDLILSGDLTLSSHSLIIGSCDPITHSSIESYIKELAF